MKKTLVAIIAACMVGCAPAAAKKTPIGSLYNNAYCLRVNATAKQGDTIHTYETHGTAFVIRAGNQTILATNKHVVELPELPEGVTMQQLTYRLVDGVNDRDVEDDQFLEVITISDSVDLALLKYDGFIPRKKVAYCDPVIGEPSYMVGFPFADMKVLDEGIVSNMGLDMKGGFFYVSSNDSLPGMSGGPVYTTDEEGDACLYGVTRGMTNPPGYAMIVPSFELEAMVMNYAEYPRNVASRFEETNPVIYDYQSLPVKEPANILEGLRAEP